jgi:hypothetical protein
VADQHPQQKKLIGSRCYLMFSSHPESSEEFQQFFGVRSMTFNAIIFIYHHKPQKTGHFEPLIIIFCLNCVLQFPGNLP